MSDLMTAPDTGLPTRKEYRPISVREYYGGAGVVALVTAVGLTIATLVTGLTPLHFALPLFVGALLFLIVRIFSMLRANKENTSAVALLAQGHIGEARQRLELIVSKYRRHPGLHSLAIYNLGVTYLREGALEQAAQLIASSLSGGWLDRRAWAQFSGPLRGALARVLVLLGDVESAKHWQREAHERIDDERRGALLLGDALILARTERFDEAARLLREHWDAAETMHQSAERKALRILRAYVVERCPSDERDPDEVRDMLAGVRPFRAGEFDYLGVRWPDITSFLERHELTRGRERSP